MLLVEKKLREIFRCCQKLQKQCPKQFLLCHAEISRNFSDHGYKHWEPTVCNLSITSTPLAYISLFHYRLIISKAKIRDIFQKNIFYFGYTQTCTTTDKLLVTNTSTTVSNTFILHWHYPHYGCYHFESLGLHYVNYSNETIYIELVRFDILNEYVTHHC